MKALADFRTRLDVLLKDDAGNLVQSDKDAALAEAAVLYSNDRPREAAGDLSGAGAFDFALSGLTGWLDGFSIIREISYPFDSSLASPTMLDADDWMIYVKPTGKVLRLVNATPASGETVRVWFTRRQRMPSTIAVVIAAAPAGLVRSSNVVTLTTDALEPHGAEVGDNVIVAEADDSGFDGSFEVASVPSENTLTYEQTGSDDTSGGGTATVESSIDADFEAVSCRAAGLSFLQLAAKKIQSADPTLAADAVDYRSKPAEYRAQAKEMLSRYNRQLGIGAGREVGAASAVANLDVDLTVGWDRLTHARRTQ